MPEKEDILREQTFKEEGMELERRVFYTLTGQENLQSDRSCKLLGFLVKTLHERGLLSDAEIDEILLECVH